MKPPYELTGSILKQTISISEKLGEINAHYLNRPTPKLRKRNKIKTIHHSLKIEGNTLSEEQITALLENKRIIGPKQDIKEVQNAIELYNQLNNFNFNSEKSFLKAHKKLMTGLISSAGQYRKKGVGIMKGSQIEHVAPPADKIPFLMKDLFKYLKNKEEIPLIKSCVFHYEMEFIHPFDDGNGRMGRLWQTLILMDKYPVFEFLPFETLISKTQSDYYDALSKSDKAGSSTAFIEYMLPIIEQSLNELLNLTNRSLTQEERLDYFIALEKDNFSRKDYLKVFKDISPATASRDLKKGVELNLFVRKGDKNRTHYKLTQRT